MIWSRNPAVNAGQDCGTGSRLAENGPTARCRSDATRNEGGRGNSEPLRSSRTVAPSEFPTPNSEFQIPLSAFRIQGIASDRLEPSGRIPNSTFRISPSQFRTPNSKFRIPPSSCDKNHFPIRPIFRLFATKLMSCLCVACYLLMAYCSSCCCRD